MTTLAVGSTARRHVREAGEPDRAAPRAGTRGGPGIRAGHPNIVLRTGPFRCRRKTREYRLQLASVRSSRRGTMADDTLFRVANAVPSVCRRRKTG